MSQQITLTPEQEARIDEYKYRYVPDVFNGGYNKKFNYNDALELVDWQYKLANQPLPLLLTVNNPYEGQILADHFMRNESAKIKELHEMRNDPKKFNQKRYDKLYSEVRQEADKVIAKQQKPQNFYDSYLFTADIFSNVLLSWYGFMIDVLQVETEVKDTFLEWRRLYEKAGIFNTICFDWLCIVSKFPKKIHVNERYDLHNTSGTVCEWEGIPWKNYYINGRAVNKADYELALEGKLTLKKFMAENNEDTRAAWVEILGPEKMMNLLGAELIDKGVIHHNNGEDETVELYKTKERFPETGNEPFAWVKFICPSTGSTYMVDVEPKHTKAVEAAVSTSPFNISVEEYKFDARG